MRVCICKSAYTCLINAPRGLEYETNVQEIMDKDYLLMCTHQVELRIYHIKLFINCSCNSIFHLFSPVCDRYKDKQIINSQTVTYFSHTIEALTFNLYHLSDFTGPRGLESVALLFEIMDSGVGTFDCTEPLVLAQLLTGFSDSSFQWTQFASVLLMH